MRILAISGSGRKGGNSETLLAALLDAAVCSGAESGGVIRLFDVDFSCCVGCDYCVPRGKCHIEDGMTAVHDRIRDSDILVLASPIYYDNVSGRFKSFFDRLRPFSKTGGRLPRKRAAAVIATWADTERDDYVRALEVYSGYLLWFGDFDYREVAGFPNLSGPGDAAADSGALAKAAALGARLVEKFSAL
ncbi:MAG: flavodoxin family protein [Planctomycetes bacterium]|nr:flavodoxin family protein [Planctomycetota bacterium]